VEYFGVSGISVFSYQFFLKKKTKFDENTYKGLSLQMHEVQVQLNSSNFKSGSIKKCESMRGS
jgi:mannose-1-phosphate guanylyltransferase